METSQVSRDAVVDLMNRDPEVGAAINVLTSECALKYGWTHGVHLQHGGGPSSVTGVPDVWRSSKEAERWGYSSAADDDTPRPQMSESQEKSIMGFSSSGPSQDDEPKTKVALPGGAVVSTASTGCHAEAQKKVYGSLEDALRLTNFINEVLPSGQKDLSKYEKVLRKAAPEYQKCMSEAGFDIKFGQARDWAEKNVSPKRKPGERPAGRELELARADGGCQEKVGLAQKLDEAYFEVAGAWVRDNEKRILGLREKKQAALERARTVLGSR
ncbi:hypothetical protein ACFO4S_08895 [Falsarthrobacter nasiphocae]